MHFIFFEAASEYPIAYFISEIRLDTILENKQKLFAHSIAYDKRLIQFFSLDFPIPFNQNLLPLIHFSMDL